MDPVQILKWDPTRLGDIPAVAKEERNQGWPQDLTWGTAMMASSPLPEVGKVMDGTEGGRRVGSSALNIILGACRIWTRDTNVGVTILGWYLKPG